MEETLYLGVAAMEEGLERREKLQDSPKERPLKSSPIGAFYNIFLGFKK
jgi:hypothetical protein